MLRLEVSPFQALRALLSDFLRDNSFDGTFSVFSIWYVLENTKNSGSMPTENEPMPRKKDMSRTVIRPDMVSVSLRPRRPLAL
jgi:hypothetical protein